jgi:hypothetical protein
MQNERKTASNLKVEDDNTRKLAKELRHSLTDRNANSSNPEYKQHMSIKNQSNHTIRTSKVNQLAPRDSRTYILTNI